jgi:hypothetical protein
VEKAELHRHGRMTRLLRSSDKLLRHPWLERLGGALLLAGLIGGLVRRVLDFPAFPLVVTMVGAFVFGIAALSRLIADRKPDDAAEVDYEQLRVAIAHLMEEVEHHAFLLLDTSGAAVWWESDRPLVADRWAEHGPLLAQYGFGDAHEACRVAYREVDDVNWIHRSVHAQLAHDKLNDDNTWALGPTVLLDMSANDVAICEKAVDSLETALNELARIPDGSGEVALLDPPDTPSWRELAAEREGGSNHPAGQSRNWGHHG